jgi:hypothetical protein
MESQGDATRAAAATARTLSRLSGRRSQGSRDVRLPHRRGDLSSAPELVYSHRKREEHNGTDPGNPRFACHAQAREGETQMKGKGKSSHVNVWLTPQTFERLERLVSTLTETDAGLDFTEGINRSSVLRMALAAGIAVMEKKCLPKSKP